jgi:hypothetical protein
VHLLRQVQEAETHGDAHSSNRGVEAPAGEQAQAGRDPDELDSAHVDSFALAAQEMGCGALYWRRRGTRSRAGLLDCSGSAGPGVDVQKSHARVLAFGLDVARFANLTFE